MDQVSQALHMKDWEKGVKPMTDALDNSWGPDHVTRFNAGPRLLVCRSSVQAMRYMVPSNASETIGSWALSTWYCGIIGNSSAARNVLPMLLWAVPDKRSPLLNLLRHHAWSPLQSNFLPITSIEHHGCDPSSCCNCKWTSWSLSSYSFCIQLVHQIFRKHEMFSLSFYMFFLFAPPAAISINDAFRNPEWSLLSSLIFSYTRYLGSLSISILVYRISVFHPLHHYPGPTPCRVSMLYHAIQTTTGRQMRYLSALHQKYGDIVRIGGDWMHMGLHRGAPSHLPCPFI